MNSCIGVADVTNWMGGFRQRAANARIPLTAYLELTSRCNLRCIHCYLGDQEEQHRKRAQECDTETVKSFISEWVEAGCLHLIITGGDPMMRNDFREIYRYACEQGLLVTVFCDGILCTEHILALFDAYPPRSVEVTLYGGTEETYEKVTRVPGSFKQAWERIHQLIAHGVRVHLKTVLMTVNKHELPLMREQAKELNCSFRFDAAVFPCLADGEEDPLDYRVLPQDVVEAEMQDPELMEGFRSSIDHFEKASASSHMYQCGAGQTAFYADPYGMVSPCLLTTHYRYSTEGRSFQEVWDGDLQEIRKVKRTRKDSMLAAGGIRGACTHCPAINFLETGDEEQDSAYMKEMTKCRHAAVTKGRETDERREE